MLQLWQPWILNPLCLAGDWTCIPAVQRHLKSCCSTAGTLPHPFNYPSGLQRWGPFPKSGSPGKHPAPGRFGEPQWGCLTLIVRNRRYNFKEWEKCQSMKAIPSQSWTGPKFVLGRALPIESGISPWNNESPLTLSPWGSPQLWPHGFSGWCHFTSCLFSVVPSGLRPAGTCRFPHKGTWPPALFPELKELLGIFPRHILK